MKRLFVFLFVCLTGVGAVASAQPVSAPYVPRGTITIRPDDVRTVKTPPVESFEEMVRRIEREQVVANAVQCPEWAGLAYDVGWEVDQIPKLLRIVYRESRCLPDACSVPDQPHLRKCRDWGLTQINDYSWKSTVRSQGMEMSDMWNPELNLRFALWLYSYSEERNGDGWQPWAVPHS